MLVNQLRANTCCFVLQHTAQKVSRALDRLIAVDHETVLLLYLRETLSSTSIVDIDNLFLGRSALRQICLPLRRRGR